MFCVRGGLVAAVAALAMVSCTSNDGNGGLATVPTLGSTAVPPTASSGPTTVASSTSSTSEVVSTTAPSVTLPAGTVGLSADGPWHLVDSAPGVTTPGLVYELMPKLWAFIQIEETDRSTYPWTLNEADRPIIEAYLNAELTYFAAVTSTPINLELPGWTDFYAHGGSARLSGLQQKSVDGQVVDMDLGVVLHPQILGDERTVDTAIVSDCILDGSVFRMPDQSLAPGSTNGVTSSDWGARLRRINGRWVIVQEGPIEGSCP